MFNAHLYQKINELEKRNEQLKQELDMKSAAARDAANALDKLRCSLDEEKRTLKFELMHAKEMASIDKEKALQAQANEMSKSLVQSDITREQALAKLAVYEKMDTKADANTIKEMVGKLIDAIGKANVNLLNK